MSITFYGVGRDAVPGRLHHAVPLRAHLLVSPSSSLVMAMYLLLVSFKPEQRRAGAREALPRTELSWHAWSLAPLS